MSIDRRDFLKLSGAGLFGVTFLPLLGGCETHVVTPLGATESIPFLTPPDKFFVQDGGKGSIVGWTRPEYASANDWGMDILDADGMLLKRITYSDVLAATPKVSMLKTIQCVLESPVRLTPTGFVGNQIWTGVPLQHFLDDAGLDYSTTSPVRQLNITGNDGFRNNIKIERIRNSETDGLIQPLLVYEMNGQPLLPDHGFPVRLIMQEGLGYKNVKWISQVRASRFVTSTGTYQDQGFVDDGVMRINSRSTSLSENIMLPTGSIEISGFAVSGFAPVEQIEIRIDGGPFQPATIVPLADIQDEESLPPSIIQLMENQEYPFKGVWTPWRFMWDAQQGVHTVEIRATDKAGNIQPETDDDITDGQTGYTRYDVTIT